MFWAGTAGYDTSSLTDNLGFGTPLAGVGVVLVRRCAWHRSYWGYTLLYGIASWRGQEVVFTDGMCRRCAARIRTEPDWPPRERPRVFPLVLKPALTLAATVLLSLAPQTVHHGPPGALRVAAGLRVPAVLRVPTSLAISSAAAAERESDGLPGAVDSLITWEAVADAPVAQSLARVGGPASLRSLPEIMETRAVIRLYDDPSPARALLSYQAP